MFYSMFKVLEYKTSLLEEHKTLDVGPIDFCLYLKCIILTITGCKSIIEKRVYFLNVLHKQRML